MAEWPLYARSAAREMAQSENSHVQEQILAAFADRWGGVTPGAIADALPRMEGDDLRFALGMLIRSGAPHARESVIPLLHDADTETRWLGALYLSTINDERALPVLWEMLAAPDSSASADSLPLVRQVRSRLDEARRHAITLAGALGDPRSAVALRGALLAIQRREQALAPPEADTPDNKRWDYDNALRFLEYEQQTIVYSLGRIGAFGAVLGVEGSEEQARLWRVQLAMGHLHGHHNLTLIVRFSQDAALAADVREVLAQQFGLGTDEQAPHLALYEQEWLIALGSYYHALELLDAMRVTG